MHFRSVAHGLTAAHHDGHDATMTTMSSLGFPHREHRAIVLIATAVGAFM